ncbi:hypothetical protein BRADI_4g13371v3 [Brachypodium distachyon]|uniref:Uncharacterized protein n=1 Tax=Brachypodium distachyon TaxID=15368 RepID=A0A0Q3ENB4_BRADI|nr:hypothetical protein BRADI_4g13371v3 [Brachypodium distachyon]
MFLLAIQSDQTLYVPLVLLQPQREIRTSKNKGGSKTHPCACLMACLSWKSNSMERPVFWIGWKSCQCSTGFWFVCGNI